MDAEHGSDSRARLERAQDLAGHAIAEAVAMIEVVVAEVAAVS
jgi:hypothetical protein